ncbi:hypothetical protein ACFY0G_38305 [Streptomyces sp. NPDC001552]|uniref:hypothetical protein n=1 Tax=Streptomyces sp. NPDC001552 TaxID=3364587 RepID=UPI003690DD59
MSYDVHAQAATRPKRRIARIVIPVASVAFISGAVALPASAAIGHPPRSAVGVLADDANPNRQPGGGDYGPNTCKPGYVWRGKWEGDTQCVTPAERDSAKGQGRLIDNGPNLIGIPGL